MLVCVVKSYSIAYIAGVYWNYFTVSVHIIANLILRLPFGEGAGEGSLLNKGLLVQGSS